MSLRFERRCVTVMLCELFDTIALFERCESATFTELVEKFRTVSLDLVQRFGGAVAYFQGDSMLACFGYPLQHSDDPDRAVRAALSLVEALKDDVAKVESGQLSVQIGIDTGEATVGRRSEQAHSGSIELFGEPISVVSQIQGLGDPNQIILSDRTNSLLRTPFKSRCPDYQTIRGLADPIAIFEARI